MEQEKTVPSSLDKYEKQKTKFFSNIVNKQQEVETEPVVNQKSEEEILNQKRQKNFLIGFSTATFTITLASCYHLVDFFMIGNPTWLSWALALAFEVVVIGILLGVGVLKDIKQGYVNTIFWVIFLLQVLGNVFSVYHNYTTDNALISSISTFFTFGSFTLSKFWVSFIVGMPLPLISFFLMKSMSSYFEETALNKYSSIRRRNR